MAFEETAHRRVGAERFEQLDSRVGQIDEDHPDAMSRKGARRQDAGAERALIELACCREIRDDDGHMVEPSDHRPCISQGLLRRQVDSLRAGRNLDPTPKIAGPIDNKILQIK